MYAMQSFGADFMIASQLAAVRRLCIVTGDQLDARSALFDDFDPARDRIWMAEAVGEAQRVWSHQARIAVFLAAMRHFRDAQRALGRIVEYRELDHHDETNLVDALRSDISRLKPVELCWVEPGEWGMREQLRGLAADLQLPWREFEDRHFLCSLGEFREWAGNRRELRMETFYRWMRRRHDVLMDAAQPLAGRWNFDAENRESLSADQPPQIRGPLRFLPDQTTQAVLDLVRVRFAEHPGELADFDWPVTPEMASAALDDFVRHRLPSFGRYQDALWPGEPWLFHSRLSVALNLKLIDPRNVIDAAVQALHAGHAELAAVEGFVRQILGWREFVRGVYWREMPGYLEHNALDAQAPLPDFYWTAETDMACLRDAVSMTLRYGYAHHIQRLMVTGLFGLLLGVDPRAMHEWYLAVYVDAIEWVELPNTLGMSQYADGGLLSSKPYVATGKYIQRMGPHCRGCRFKPERSTGADACPFTTLYWDFLIRHRTRFQNHPRMALQVRNLQRLDEEAQALITEHAERLREQFRGRASLHSGSTVGITE